MAKNSLQKSAVAPVFVVLFYGVLYCERFTHEMQKKQLLYFVAYGNNFPKPAALRVPALDGPFMYAYTEHLLAQLGAVLKNNLN